MAEVDEALAALVETYVDGGKRVSAIRWNGTNLCEQAIRAFTGGKVHWNHKHTALGRMGEGAFWHISLDSWIVQDGEDIKVIPNHAFQNIYVKGQP